MSIKSHIARIAAAVFVSVAASAAGVTAAMADGTQGSFGLVAMAHTEDWPNNAEVNPWDGKSKGEFVYRSIPCSGNAPINNNSSNLPSYASMIPGGHSPSSTRNHPFKFTVDNGKMTGSIALTVCKLGPGPADDGKADTERDRIDIAFTADAKASNAEEMDFSGTFEIKGGTGRYVTLTGSGTIRGYLICFDPNGCVAGNKGMLRDLQYVMQGDFSDPSFKP